MNELNQNDRYKDALFRIVFGENRENALSLYNAINNTNYTNIDDLKITMLRDSVYIGVRNDVSFLFNHNMNLYEHQSTYSPNMPLRGLGYFADLYKMHLGGDEDSVHRIYSSSIIKIPAPKYYVFYNGLKEEAEQTELRLSDAYDGAGDIEIVAHMINVNKGHNKALMEHCKPMSDYSEFVFRVRACIEKGLSKEAAVKQAIDECIRDDILKEMLQKERARVENILIRGLSDEEKDKMYKMLVRESREEGYSSGHADGREEGYSSGHADGCEETRLEDIDRFVAGGLADVGQACKILGVSVEAYESYRSQKNK